MGENIRCRICNGLKRFSQLHRAFLCPECDREAGWHKLRLRDDPRGLSGRMGRKCNKCGKTKPAAEFYNKINARDGLSTYCKTCDRVRLRASDARRREAMGDEAWREQHNQRQRARRARLRSQSDPLDL